MAEKFLNTFPIKSHRLAGYDYGSKGAYFVTLKTFRMECYFGEIVKTSQGTSPPESKKQIEETCLSTSRHWTELGLKAKENWEAIPRHFSFVKLDVFEIMPNHIHGILFIEQEKATNTPNQFKSMPGTLGTIINQFKGSVTKYANLNNIAFRWHPSYHDIIIKNEKSLNNIRNYIQNNPQKWWEKYKTE